ncbi:TetR/AcrR family transcriptional regulator [Occultella gossypii]|uniref:WHG domain-containing protein n=1 Tax=Occultella gossypii TaxID=2800820 RepID=A0ABS7S6F8_9MICO|nr:TetR-like C-terminal domain-containing protein [Occultella gossypii]MBZ2195917.1 WHG domain-containing protein [Occultella gossypii]
MARPRTHDETLRTSLLEHASRALSATGPDGMSLRAVTAAAGTTTAAVYTLFGGRDGLIAAVVDEGFERFGRHLAAVPRTGDPGADLFALGLAYRESALADPHFYRVMFAADGVRRSKDTLAEPTFGVLRDAVARLPSDAVGEAGPEPMALRLWGLVHGLVSLELAGLLPGDEREHAHRYAGALRPSAR